MQVVYAIAVQVSWCSITISSHQTIEYMYINPYYLVLYNYSIIFLYSSINPSLMIQTFGMYNHIPSNSLHMDYISLYLYYSQDSFQFEFYTLLICSWTICNHGLLYQIIPVSTMYSPIEQFICHLMAYSLSLQSIVVLFVTQAIGYSLQFIHQLTMINYIYN